MIVKRFLVALSITAFLALFLVNCSSLGKNKLIPEKKFVNVLADIHLADGIGVDLMNSDSARFVLDSASLYGSVFRKYHVTWKQFDNTMAYYSTHPEDCQRIYNKVVARLKKMQEELKQQEQEQEKKKVK